MQPLEIYLVIGTRFVRLALGLSLVATAFPTPAQTDWGRLVDMQRLSASEWAVLPEYCPNTLVYHQGGPAYQDWVTRLGPGFSAMHHYCWGLVKARRASSVVGQFRSALLEDAIREIEYVRSNTPEDFVLRPEVLLRGGQWAATLEQHARALEYFEASIKAKTDYWPAYLEIANVNLAIKRRQHAVEALRRGLEQAPAQPALQAALARIEADRTLGMPRGQRPER
jgi:tetratricopeptide (TPR) repeat protein